MVKVSSNLKMNVKLVMPLVRLAVNLLPTVTAAILIMPSTSPMRTSVRAVAPTARHVKVNQLIALAVIQLSTL